MENSSILSSFGCRLKKAREDANMTQQELADKFGGTKSMISQYENGATDPRMTLIPKLANILCVPIEWLISGEKTETRKTVYIIEQMSNEKIVAKSIGSLDADEIKKLTEYADFLISKRI